MTAILQQLGLERMTIRERIELAQAILDSVVAEQPRPPISEALMAELRRRAADADANPHDGVSLDVAEAAALARFTR